MGMGMESLSNPFLCEARILRAFSETNGISSQRQPTQTAVPRRQSRMGCQRCGECAVCMGMNELVNLEIGIVHAGTNVAWRETERCMYGAGWIQRK